MIHLSEDQLEEYLLGRLQSPAREGIMEHLLVCEDCRKLHDEVEAYQTIIRASIDPAPKYDLAVVCRKAGYSEEARAIATIMEQRSYSVWAGGEQTWEAGASSGEEWFDILRKASRASYHSVIFDRGARDVTLLEQRLGVRARRLIWLYHNTTLLYFGISNIGNPYRSLSEAMDLIEDALLRPEEVDSAERRSEILSGSQDPLVKDCATS